LTGEKSKKGTPNKAEGEEFFARRLSKASLAPLARLLTGGDG